MENVIRKQHDFKAMTVWVVLTDGRRIRIVEVAKPGESPQEVGVTGSLGFDQVMGTRLEQAQQLGLFDHLMLVAPENIIHELKHILTRELRVSLLFEWKKDLMDADAAVICAGLPL